ncbi:MAG: hypothetical protein Q7R67_02750 [bacterium]|nr:hypothetical protein [bacterium]
MAGSIFALDIVDNKSDLRDWRADESDKVLILKKSETYRLYKDDIGLILVAIIVAPVSSVISIFSGFYYPSHGFYPEDEAYLQKWEIIGKFVALVTYILLPIGWILYSRKLLMVGSSYTNKLRLISIIILLLGCLSSSFFAVRAMFENFKGFF